jgi:hypothetical protein
MGDGQDKVKELIGIKESDTGLSLPSQWDLVSDKQMMQEEQPLQVARCTKIINPGQEVRLQEACSSSYRLTNERCWDWLSSRMRST